ncbi:MAG: tetratricopeptide repeat protein, partial [Chloroflexota bacterium]|nr:tetratricopeptide repeat protein [Chloroflexota bacterium]
HLLFAVALLAILLSTLLVVVPGSHALAHNTIFTETPTATPDANQILNQANQATTEAQRTLNVISIILGFFSFIVGILAILAGVLTSVGIILINRYRKQLNEERQQLSEEREEAIKKRTDMDNTLKAVVYLGLGDRLYDQDKKQEAVAIYRKVGSLLPGDSEINYSLGRIYSGSEYYEDAIATFNAALSANPNFAEAEMELGLAYRRRGEAQKEPDAEVLRNADYDQAVTHLKRAINLRPNYEDALAGLGAAYRRMGDKERDTKAREYYEQAKEYYKQAHMADPSSSYALGNVASLSWFLGEQKAANSYFTLAEAVAKVRIMNAGRSPEIYWDYYDLALAQLVIGTVTKDEATKDEAIKTYHTAIQLTPGTVQLNSVLNNLYLLQKARDSVDRLDIVIALLVAGKSE